MLFFFVLLFDDAFAYQRHYYDNVNFIIIVLSWLRMPF